MRERAGVVLIRDGKILLMFRHHWSQHNGHEYYILPGGTIEPGENPEEAVVRELKEETGLDITIQSKLFEHEVPPGTSKYGRQHYFLASAEGEPVLGGEESAANHPDDYYELRWVPINDLPATEIFHPDTKKLLLEALVDKIDPAP